MVGQLRRLHRVGAAIDGVDGGGGRLALVVDLLGHHRHRARALERLPHALLTAEVGEGVGRRAAEERHFPCLEVVKVLAHQPSTI